MQESSTKQSVAAAQHGWLLGAAGLLGALTLLAVAIVGINLSLSRLAESRGLVIRSNAVLARMAELQTTVRAAETGQRGYILTGDLRYLTPYQQAVGRIWSDFAGAERLVVDAAQQERLRALRPLIQAKLDELAQTVDLRRESFEAAVEVVRSDLGQRLMEEIDALFQGFRVAQNDLLDARTLRLEQNVRWTTGLTALAGLLAIVSAVLGAVSLARHRAQAQLLQTEQAFRRDLEERVEERTAELTEVNRELDAFAYTISHDLRAPLRAMHGYAEALDEDCSEVLPKEGQQYLERIKAAALRMEDFIEDILAYSRLVRSEVSLRPTSLEPIVDQVLSRLSGVASEAKAAVEVQRPLPNVQAHSPTLAQVVENLISNAFKFTAPGSALKVRIFAEQRGTRVRLVVEDQGIGIASEHQSRIFRPFERLHGVETYPGTGIGLAIVRRAVERMGGACGVASTLGQGSQFWLELPVAKETSS